MSRRLIIQCAAAQTIGALFDGGEAVKFWFAPARGDEAAPRPVDSGDLCLARVKATAPPLNGAFVDIGEPSDAFLALRKGDSPHVEGARVIVRVKRPALGRKGPVVNADWRRGLAADSQAFVARAAAARSAPGLLSPPVDAAVAVMRKAQPLAPASVAVDRPEAALALRRAGADAAVDEPSVFAADLIGEIERALQQEAPLFGGARLVFDETEAGAAIDVDMASAAANGAARNDAVNRDATARLFRELAKRDIGGRIVVDFLPPSSAAQRASLLAALAESERELFPRRTGRLARDGLFDCTAPRTGPSLLARLSEPADGDLRKGRRLSLDWAAILALASAERRLARSPALTFELLAGEALATYLQARLSWLARIRERFGARLTIVCEKRLERTQFDIVESQRGA
jgi:Ribonuclease G/E